MPLPVGRPRAQVAGKRGGDLEREVLAAAAVAGLHVHLGVFGRDVEVHGHRHVALAAGLGGDGVAHATDDVPVHEQRVRISASSRMRMRAAARLTP